MRVLVTGQLGHVGVPVAGYLRDRGYAVVGFDRAEGADLLDLPALKRAAAGCAAIVHLGALAHDSAGSPDEIMAVNVLGTWHVLLAAEGAGVARVVHFSSAQVFGIAEGERLPAYFPIDDAMPRQAMRPYGLSKRLAETCARASLPALGSRVSRCARSQCGDPHSTAGPGTGGALSHARSGIRTGSTARSWTSAM